MSSFWFTLRPPALQRLKLLCSAPHSRHCCFHFLSLWLQPVSWESKRSRTGSLPASTANMLQTLKALHPLLAKALCLQSHGGPKGAPLRRPPHEAQRPREARTAAGLDLLRQCWVEWNYPTKKGPLRRSLGGKQQSRAETNKGQLRGN